MDKVDKAVAKVNENLDLAYYYKNKLKIAVEGLREIRDRSFQGGDKAVNLGFHVLAAATLTDIGDVSEI